MEIVSLQGDYNSFTQIILAIIQNSIYFFKARNIKNPKILIEVKRINNQIEIFISDNAGGTKEENLPKIFDYGFSYRDDKQNSTGIGLYITKLIVKEKFKGEIYALNTKNGLEFKILLSSYNLAIE